MRRFSEAARFVQLRLEDAGDPNLSEADVCWALDEWFENLLSRLMQRHFCGTHVCSIALTFGSSPAGLHRATG